MVLWDRVHICSNLTRGADPDEESQYFSFAYSYSCEESSCDVAGYYVAVMLVCVDLRKCIVLYCIVLCLILPPSVTAASVATVYPAHTYICTFYNQVGILERAPAC